MDYGMPWPVCRDCPYDAEWWGKGYAYCHDHYVERFGTEPPEGVRIAEVRR